ncbi:hypothetical protein L21SP2_1413 [Salinispira pacifica]|uniref:Uncharacterized protein n=2 Tax=Salinispira pacifica TaxID=1307761 RepID=V5WG44_9SPIO|nr:hypothetical protein L21SP2_1413 [Salinispira pacifica]
MAKALLGLHKADTAVQHLKVYIQNHSDNRKIGEAMIYLGDAYMAQDQKDQAKKVYQRALNIPSIDDVCRRKANSMIRKIEGKA